MLQPIFLVGALVLGQLSLPVFAQSVRFVTAGDLFLKLTSPRLEEQLAGQHYVMGVLDGLTLAKDPRLCVRTEIQINEVVTLVRGQLNTRPDVHRYNAASVIRETLATEFPCT
jgi:hypothetical protein